MVGSARVLTAARIRGFVRNSFTMQARMTYLEHQRAATVTGYARA